MAHVIMNAKCIADHDSPDSMLPRALCLTCNPRKRQTIPRERTSASAGVSLAPPLAIYKALAADLSDETEKEITASAEIEMQKIGPKEAALRLQREAVATSAKKLRNKEPNPFGPIKELVMNAPPPTQEVTTQETAMSRTATAKKTKTAAKKTAKSSARKTVKSSAARPTKAGGRKTYDWAGAKEKALTGIIPPAPDFSAHTHRFYREPLAQAVALVKAGDLKALQALKFARDDGSPGMIKRYRDIAVIALKSKK